MPRASVVQRKIVAPLVGELRRGLGADELARCAAVGTALGLFPVPGTTTALCVLAAGVLRLNQVAMQAVNWAVSPLWLLMIVPFARLGARLFGAAPPPLSASALAAAVQGGWWHGITLFGGVLARGVVAWAVTMPPIAFVLYLALRPVMRRVAARVRPAGVA